MEIAHVRYISTQTSHVSRAQCSRSIVINMLGRSRTFPSSQEVSSRPRCSKPGLRTRSTRSQLETQIPGLSQPPASESAWSGASGGVTLLQSLVRFRGSGWGGLRIPVVATGLRAPLAPSACLQAGCVLDKIFTYPGKVG